ncbi:MAG: tyrosine-type recombinase/integrase [Methanobacterium sp.]
MLEIVKQDPVFLNWKHGLSEGAEVQYGYALADFCIAIGKKPDEILKICKKELEVPFWERSINSWFPKYDDYCQSIDRARKTRNFRRGLILNFFHFNRIETPRPSKREARKFRTANKRKLPSKEEYKIFLNGCNTIKQKAIILTQISSGLSNSDVCNLNVGQFKNGLDNNDVCYLHLFRKKTEIEFTTFLSPEAVEAINTYLTTEREDLKNNQPLFTKHKTKNQPLKPKSIGFIYKRNSDKLGWDKGGNTFRKITGHMSRKWFNTQLTMAGMPEEIREHFMGHKMQNNVKDAYFLGNPDDLKRVYIQYLPHITINPTKTFVVEDEGYKSLKNENTNLRKELDQIKKDLGELNGFREVLKHPKVRGAMEEVSKNR